MYTKLVFTPYDVCQGIVGIFVPKQDVPSFFPVQRQDNLLRWSNKKENEGGGTSTMSSNLSNSPLITDSARSSCCFKGFSLLLTWWRILLMQRPWQSYLNLTFDIFLIFDLYLINILRLLLLIDLFSYFRFFCIFLPKWTAASYSIWKLIFMNNL